VAALHARDGGGLDGSRLDTPRSVALSSAAVAAASGCMSKQ